VHDWSCIAKAVKRDVNISARVHDLQNFVALLRDTFTSAFSLSTKARLTVAIAVGSQNTKRIAVGSRRRGRH
jgi:hypothetical protein